MYTTVDATCATSNVASTFIEPSACAVPDRIRAVMSVRGLADVDLTARNVVLAPVERGRLGQAGHRVLGRRVGSRVGARHVGRDRAVVDGPAEQVLTS